MSSVYFTATHKPYWYQRDTVQFISLQICEIQCVVKRWYKTGHWTLDWYRFHIFIVYFNHWAIVFFECPKMLHMPIMCTIWAVWVTKQWLMTFLNLNKHYIKNNMYNKRRTYFLISNPISLDLSLTWIIYQLLRSHDATVCFLYGFHHIYM